MQFLSSYTLQRCTHWTECKLPENLPTPILTAMLNNLRLYSGSLAKSSLRRFFFGRLSRFGLQAHLYTPEQGFPPFHSSLEETFWDGCRIGPKGGTHAPDELHLHRVLHELRLLAAGRQSGGRDREQVRHPATTDPRPWWCLRDHHGQRPGLFQEETGTLPAAGRGRGRAREAALCLTSSVEPRPVPLPAPRRRPPRAGAEDRGTPAAGPAAPPVPPRGS